jgi:hypothetical protein
MEQLCFGFAPYLLDALAEFVARDRTRREALNGRIAAAVSLFIVFPVWL